MKKNNTKEKPEQTESDYERLTEIQREAAEDVERLRREELEKQEQPKKTSRRAFLQSAALGFAGIVLAGTAAAAAKPKPLKKNEFAEELARWGYELAERYGRLSPANREKARRYLLNIPREYLTGDDYLDDVIANYFQQIVSQMVKTYGA